MAHTYLNNSHCFQSPTLTFNLLQVCISILAHSLWVYENHIIWTGKDNSMLQHSDNSVWLTDTISSRPPLIHLLFLKTWHFWKPALLLSSGKEIWNSVAPLHRAILSQSLSEYLYSTLDKVQKKGIVPMRKR